MKIKVKRDNLIIGGIEFKADGSFEFSPDASQELKNLAESFAKNPVVLQDFSDSKTGTFKMAKMPISKSDPNFSLAFKEWLTREGYEVIEENHEILEEIKKLLAEFPDDNLDKKEILAKLPTMSRLEASAILEGLKQIDKED